MVVDGGLPGEVADLDQGDAAADVDRARRRIRTDLDLRADALADDQGPAEAIAHDHSGRAGRLVLTDAESVGK